MVFSYSLEGIIYFFIILFSFLILIWYIRLIRISRKIDTKFFFFRTFFKTVLRIFYFFLLIIALLGPSWGGEKKQIKAVGKDIFIAVDLSNSMNAVDIKPTRMEKVKLEMKRIIKSFISDRIGIIIFSSDAFIQCPLTFDKSALNLFVETLSSSLVPSGGTNLEPPLTLALEKHTSEQEGVGKNNAKIIILISDGEDFNEGTEEIVQSIKDKDIKLFTLGVGTEQGSVIPIGQNQNKKNTDGMDIVTKLNANLLKKLASTTNGAYFEIDGKSNQVNSLINSINKITGELQDTRTVDVSANKYYYFLYLALIFIVIDVIISVKTFRI